MPSVQNDCTTQRDTVRRVAQAQEAQQTQRASDVDQQQTPRAGEVQAQEPARASVDAATQGDARRVAAGGDDAARARALAADPAARVSSSSPVSRGLSDTTLRRGSRDEAGVRALQERLNERGASPRVEVDGRFGRATEAAVRQFQRANGLGNDGVVGPRTREALNGSSSTTPARPGETRPGQTQGPSGTTPQTPQAPGTDPTMPGTRISGGPNRSQFDAELRNPAVRARMQALAVAEVGSHPQAQRALMETIFNRAQATGKTLMETMNSRYYQPMQNGGGPMRRAEAAVRNSPALQRQLDDAMRDVRAGSNVSNYATDNSSAGVARAAERSQVITARIGGETFSRKEGRRNGVSHADYRPWLNNHPRNP